ncbi:hypothetical protein [Clavibacter sp. CFBP 8614]|uniref:hypothetical protein n=1 Tax=unclassified Clavibacter TaxID=2626594 RepID=UPI0040433C39
MSITTTTHLNFRGTARQALELYRSVLGGDVVVATYADLGMPAEAPGADKVVFGQLETADGLRLIAYDVPGHDDADGSAIAGTTTREQGASRARRSPTAPSSSRCGARPSPRSSAAGRGSRRARP